MKRSKILVVIATLAAIIFGFPSFSYGQIVFPEVKVGAVNYKYLSSVDNKEVAEPVRRLQQEAAVFDVKDPKYFEDEYNTYLVTFELPEGKILAAYDSEGKLLRTAEKFKNTVLPKAVGQSALQKYPGWRIAEDVYLVNFHDRKGTTKTYKLLLEKGDKRMKVKMNEKGEVI
ncbi:nicotinate-nucleotide adenylyltransferase [Rufibacter sp. DG15C]|uniref:nicotinate-nucleotide adenylyltransferase n=1 Tax=Rufibacter sp. DG15C TaxID=1379909 RepID=UPI00078C98EE|nr:nicotinate-nucleotide adenylyltransferase [Rufibacter sp. DG15C]AMM52535.1 nicotinate-nucleotide adenylyltransferase [Rufibacter sp. DG15C]